MALKDIFEQNTADIALATELLKELADREGLYVWEKLTAEGGDLIGHVVADDETSYPNGGMLDGYYYELSKAEGQYVWKKYKEETKAVTISFTNVPPNILEVSSNDFNVHDIDVTFFTGASGTYDGQYSYSFPSDGVMNLAGTNYTFTYNAATAQIVLNTTLSNNVVVFSNTSVERKFEIDKSYLVSDDPTAYPNGGTQDGYWYELMSEGVSGIDYGEVTLTSTSSSITVAHNLKVSPRIVGVIPIGHTSREYRTFLQVASSSPLIDSYKTTAIVRTSSMVANQIVDTLAVMTDTSFTMNQISYGFHEGTYLWFAIV